MTHQQLYDALIERGYDPDTLDGSETPWLQEWYDSGRTGVENYNYWAERT